jgi:heme A synthase
MFTGLTALLALVIVVQFYLAASAAFDTAGKDESFQSHRALGYGIVLLAVLVTIAAALARMPGRLVGMTALIAGLGVLQGVIRALAAAFGDTAETSTTAGKLVFGLHAVNGLIMLTLSMTVARRARSRPAGERDDAGLSGPAVGPARPAS